MALSNKISKQLSCTQNMKKIQREKRNIIPKQSYRCDLNVEFHREYNLYVYIMYAILFKCTYMNRFVHCTGYSEQSV